MLKLTLLRKLLMALTGLFLCVFLVIHLLGNLQLFLPKDIAQERFNAHSQALSGNPFIKAVAIALHLSILARAIYAVVIAMGERPMREKKPCGASWSRR